MKNIRKLSFISPLLITGAINIAAQEKPNILIIHTDEQNFRTLGCYRQYLSEDQAFPWGKEVAVETPNIDAMASQRDSFHALLCHYASQFPQSGIIPQRIFSSE